MSKEEKSILDSYYDYYELVQVVGEGAPADRIAACVLIMAQEIRSLREETTEVKRSLDAIYASLESMQEQGLVR